METERNSDSSPKKSVCIENSEFSEKCKPAARKCAESSDFVAQIVGVNGLCGVRMSNGEVLDMIDILAGRIAVRHCHCLVATVAFDKVTFFAPIYHQDLIQARGQVALVGSSSMTIKITVHRFDLLTRKYQYIQSCLVTMVALIEQGVPNKNIPGLLYEAGEEILKSEALEHKSNTIEWNKAQDSIEDIGTLSIDSIDTDFNRSRSEHLTINQTEIVIRHTFMPRDLNKNSTVFGGHVLLLMQRLAVHCARAFTGNINMVLQSINRLHFKKYLLSSDSVEMLSHVVYVSKYYLEVEIVVRVIRIKSNETFLSHNGFFTLTSLDSANQPIEINRGILLSNEDQDSLKRFAKAKIRQQWSEPETRIDPPMENT